MRPVVIPLRPPRGAVWASLLAAGLAYEIHEVRDGPDGFPLTRVIRCVFRTDTPIGRAAFVAFVERGSGWLIKHILDEQPTHNHHEGIRTS